ncbi:hypothetical protein L218DRAFT_1006356 [Marasmius fiardii PR-910]|nr:hypothetical protein L218DRAFT_1006356 [Marasmius fiardii PR-910]
MECSSVAIPPKLVIPGSDIPIGPIYSNIGPPPGLDLASPFRYSSNVLNGSHPSQSSPPVKFFGTLANVFSWSKPDYGSEESTGWVLLLSGADVVVDKDSVLLLEVVQQISTNIENSFSTPTKYAPTCGEAPAVNTQKLDQRLDSQ